MSLRGLPRCLPRLRGSGLQPEGGSKEKDSLCGEEAGALAPAAARRLPRGAGPPCAQHLEDRSWGQWGTRAPSPERGQGTGRKSKSVPTAGGGGGLLRRPGAAAAAAASGAHVSTTRMSGMDLGLGGLAILTPPRFSVVAQVCVLKLLWLICFSIRCSIRSCISKFSASR